jgi:hypothetical protein
VQCRFGATEPLRPKGQTPEKMIEHPRKKEEESVNAAVHGLKDGEDKR